jgi:dihydrofolate synthase/folylpolyglutamate synthase
MSDTSDTLAWLVGLRAGGSRLGLDRMHELVRRLGLDSWLQRTPTFHVAGTNGKGSTCAMIAAIQSAHGRKTGLYTSPHLVRVGERIKVDGVSLSTPRLLAYVEQLRPIYRAIVSETPDLAPTFFELMTAIAWLEFREQACDVVVLETGLGGRLDATTACHPLATAITSIGLDHQEYLGNTLAAIAGEKAGILKPSVPCVVGALPPEAYAVIATRAQSIHAPLSRFSQKLATNLEGEYQQVNAGIALDLCLLAAATLPIDLKKAQAALRTVDWPARWQRLSLADGRTLIIDAAHNEEGARYLDPQLAKLNRPTIIVGATGDTRATPLLEVVARHATHLILVEPATERATSVARLLQLTPKTAFPVETSSVAKLFPAKGRCAAPGDVVVVVGSLYLAGEVLARLEGELPDATLQDRLSSGP